MIDQVFDWFSPSVTQHVALALTHSLWQGMIVAFAVDLVLRFVRDKAPTDEGDGPGRSAPAHTRANLRYTIACMALLVMAALPVANLAVLEIATEHVAQAEPVAEQAAEALVAEVQFGEPPAIGGTAVQSEAVPAGAVEEMEPADAEQVLVGGPAREGVAATPWVRRFALQVFFWVWFVGVSLLSLWHSAGWLLSQRLRRGATPGREILTLVEQTALRMGIWRAVTVRQSDKATTPMVIGWIKPALVLPAKLLAGLAPRELEAVLAHELAHIRRHDYLVNLVQTVVETLLFYHPGVWWVSGRIRCEREFCADDMAMRVFDGRDVYARSLVAVAETALAPSAHAMAATGGSLLHRVHRILRLGNQPSPLPWSAKCSALVGVTAAICLSVALIAVAEAQPDRNKKTNARQTATNESAGTDDANKQAPRPTAEQPGYRIDRNIKTRKWRAMISLARNLPSIRAGHGQMTLMRVVLEDGAPDAPVQLTSTKLVLPEKGSGGGLYQQIRNGDFVLVEHISSSERKDDKDPVEIGSFTHHRSTIWLDVPARGELAVLGDVIISPVPEEQMGRIVAAAMTTRRQRINMSELRIGPIAVGGPYGEAIPLHPNLPTDTGKIAPGTYKILLPDFDMKKSRWTVEVRPGEATQLQFVAQSQREVEKVSEARIPDGTPKRDRPSQTTPYADVLQFLTIAPEKLPEGCKLSEPSTALVVPMGIILDRKVAQGIAMFFGVHGPLELNQVQAAVTVVYEEAGKRSGMEIGAFALCFSDDESADRVVDRLPKGVIGHDNDRTYISNGGLALFVWRDTGVTDASFEWFCNYFRKTKFGSPETAESSKPVESAELADSLEASFFQAMSRSEYGEKDLEFIEIKSGNEGEVEIEFTAMLETLYFCPGANAKTTEKGIELTFVRSYYKTKPKVTYPAKRVNMEQGMAQVIVVPAKGKAVFLRDGKKLVKLFPRPATDGAQGRDATPGDQTLVATVFGKPLYLDRVTPASVDVKRKELPQAEFDEWLRGYRGRLTYQNVWRPVRQKYVERENISITEEDRAGIAEFAAREMESIPKARKGTEMTPEKRRAMTMTFWDACLMDWKVCKALYEKHGGRVGMGSLGAWIAFDAQNALLREHLKAGDIKFHHAETEKAFWEHTKIKNFADAYPKGERLKQYLASPPYLRHRAREKSEEHEPPTDREQIGEVFGRPVYRDEIRENFRLPAELHRIFHGPVARHYRADHREETELTDEEVQAALRYHAQEAEAKGGSKAESWQSTIEREREEAPKMMARLEEMVANPDLTDKEREELELQRVGIERSLAQPGGFFITFYYSKFKFHQYLYRNYGGGRIMGQQLGPEAYDAQHRWLREREEAGDFQVTDAKLRDELYEYWTRKDESWKGATLESLGDNFCWPWDN